ncbi:phage holin family protein [Croceicoccus bisphenolivorans]|uniref:phage holin family protein n=1 Tax=Croceicoccus bisphenolivorans TaxID=1783232 RepID=UPI00082E5884|nr:phage holin family protein [Croceicoccus bisphenolivorans]
MLDSTRYQAEASESDPAADRSLAEDIKALVSDGRLLAEAEIDFHRKRAIFGAKEGQKIAASFAIAGVLAFFALMALVVGLVLALGQIIGYWGSTVVVTAALVILALVFVSKGKARLARLKTVLSEEEDA